MPLNWGYWKTLQRFWNASPLKYLLHDIIPLIPLILCPCIEATERLSKDSEMLPLSNIYFTKQFIIVASTSNNLFPK
jgi:hypothetical protein